MATLTTEEIALDHAPLTFGKYRGQTPDEVSEEDPGYIVWMYDNIKNKPTCSRTLRDVCEEDKYGRRIKDDTEDEIRFDL